MCSRQVLDEVLAALPEGLRLRPSEVAKRQRFLAPTTVRHALRELCKEGSVTYEGDDGHRLYMRTAGFRTNAVPDTGPADA